MIRILVVDDQCLIRRLVANRLAALAGFEVVAEASSGEAARRVISTACPDVVLMDLHMPGMGGIEATRQLLAIAPELRIIGLSAYQGGPFPPQFLRNGGAGYVSKLADPEELVAAIHAVHRGERYISSDVAQRIAAEGSESGVAGALARLPLRELQVLQLITLGCAAGEIAARLRISGKTVAHYRRALVRKLAVGNDVQLANLARQHGIADIDVLPE